MTDKILGDVIKLFENPVTKKKLTSDIAELAKPSVLASIKKKKEEIKNKSIEKKTENKNHDEQGAI